MLVSWVSLWFDTEWLSYVTVIYVSANEALSGGGGGGGGGGGVKLSLIPVTLGTVSSLSLKVSTVLSLKVSLLEFFPQTKAKKRSLA